MKKYWDLEFRGVGWLGIMKARMAGAIAGWYDILTSVNDVTTVDKHLTTLSPAESTAPMQMYGCRKKGKRKKGKPKIATRKKGNPENRETYGTRNKLLLLVVWLLVESI